MYQGNNPKAILSIKLLSDALITEMTKCSYKDISVKDLCKTADVSRQTFYNIFGTKDELLRQSIHSFFDDVIAQRTNQETIDARASLTIFVQTFYNNREFMELLVKNNLGMVLLEQFMQSISNLSEMTKQSDTTLYVDYHLAFYFGGLTHILYHWLKDDNRISLEKLIDILSNSIKLPYF